MANQFIIHICTHTDVVEKNNSSALTTEIKNHLKPNLTDLKIQITRKISKPS